MYAYYLECLLNPLEHARLLVRWVAAIRQQQLREVYFTDEAFVVGALPTKLNTRLRVTFIRNDKVIQKITILYDNSPPQPKRSAK